MKIRDILLLIFAAAFPLLTAQTDSAFSKKFGIVYQADVRYARSKIWLDKIQNNWKATGINLRIFRSRTEKFNGTFIWNDNSYNIDDALTKIAYAGLDIYIRINLASLNSRSINNVYNNDDFYIRSNGKRFLNEYAIRNPILNITSLKSRGDMLGFIRQVVNHLNSLPDTIRNRIKLIVPSISPDDETEFPFNTYDDSTKSIIDNVLTGYSGPEISAFMKFLKKRYGSIDSLNVSWGESADFTKFDSSQIQIRNYNWDGIKSNSESPDYYKYVVGRKDFMDFRTEELKRFIDDCSVIVKNAGFNFGVQFGSLYDGLIEFRGFYDPTSLIENTNMLITDDILEYYPNFSFSADYSRSLCKYWSWEEESLQSKEFATEINWPGYSGHNAADLIKYWSLQLRTFYERGASCLFVSQWGTEGGPNNVAEKVLSDSALADYAPWQDTLVKYRNAQIKIINNSYAFQLACEQGLNYRKDSSQISKAAPAFVHNNPFIVGHVGKKAILEFPLCKFTQLVNENNNMAYYKGHGDFITTYMLQNSPNYADHNYKKFYLTATSVYMPKSVKSEHK